MEEENDDDIYFLADDLELERILKKAEAQLDGLSNIEQLLDQLDEVLNQYADDNGYKRTPTCIGIHTEFIWSHPNSRPADDIFIDDASILLDFLIPKKYPPLWRLMQNISANSNFSLCKIIALLILRQLASGNLYGAIEAEKSLDDMHMRILPLATEGYATQERRRKGGKRKAGIQADKAIQRQKKIKPEYERLIEQGRNKREIASILATRHGVSTFTIRRDLKKLKK